MIKRYEQYIKEQMGHLELDPFGEEEWDDDLPMVLQIAKRYNTRYDQTIELDCTNNELTSLKGIENLVNLQVLWCYDNSLNSLEGIENLFKLEYLNCRDNQLTSLKEIENLVNLRYLNCRDNLLTNLDGIENLVYLKYLFCDRNLFTEEYKEYLREYYKEKNIKCKI